VSATPLILSLETATLGGSVFLGRGSVQLAARIGNPQVSQSSSLLQDISDSLEEANVPLQDVDLFACASGPGSFTGLRIGIATLKALAASLKRPCIGIPTLQAVAQAAGYSSATIAVLPAGRGEVFAQMFSVSDNEIVN
jgi:tRNA threonylcarbamoyladenosine biosynthesis protein TsaB